MAFSSYCEVWRGNIVIDEIASNDVRDVHLRSPHTCPKSLIPGSCSLKFLAIVNVSDISLVLAAGPTLEVSTSETATEDYFTSILLENEQNYSEDVGGLPWWQRPLQQSEHGILLRVENGPLETHSAVTEILVYAAVAIENTPTFGMITPPRSSSPDLEPATEYLSSHDGLTLKLYALPINSTRLNPTNADKETNFTRSIVLNGGEARFLPTSTTNNALDPFPPKRRKLSTVFDDATNQRRRVKGRGGESISRIMGEASLEHPPKSTDKTSKHSSIDTTQGVRDALPTVAQRRGLSRSLSVMSLPSAEQSRPPSRRETFVPSKRSSLHRVESMASNLDSPVNADGDSSVEHQNKTILARIVMAGMRMHGLQQQKKFNKSQSLNGTEDIGSQRAITGDSTDDPDEYKAIYHQTFKAASFTFRARFSTEPIAQDSMRDVVDYLLSLFCIDPSSRPNTVSLSAPMFGSQEDKALDAFDQPRSSLAETAAVVTSSLRKKR